MPNNAPHNALRAAVNRALVQGSPAFAEMPVTTKWHVFVKGTYVGESIATFDDMRRDFPHSDIIGQHVHVWAPSPRKEA